jgi:hypothetical protein
VRVFGWVGVGSGMREGERALVKRRSSPTGEAENGRKSGGACRGDRVIEARGVAILLREGELPGRAVKAHRGVELPGRNPAEDRVRHRGAVGGAVREGLTQKAYDFGHAPIVKGSDPLTVAAGTRWTWALLRQARSPADARGVNVNEIVLVQGMADTRATLRRWNTHPWPVLASWLAGAVAVAAILLFAVFVVASVATPDLTRIELPGYTDPGTVGDVARVLLYNSTVLALHATACVGGFIAGSSLPLSAERRSGLSRVVHEKARPVALAWIIAVTCFSLATQAYILGSTGATLAAQLHVSPLTLVLTVIPHAIPELTALFLPLAAWTIASRRGEWDELLAATFVTVAIAIPVLVAAATWEVYVWPHLLAAVSPLG